MKLSRLVGGAVAVVGAVAVRDLTQKRHALVLGGPRGLAHGLDPTTKSVRCAVYVRTLRKELVKVPAAVGVVHPGLITAGDIDTVCGLYEARSLASVYGYKDGWGELGPQLQDEITRLMHPQAKFDERTPS
jgi:hypothetical protein